MSANFKESIKLHLDSILGHYVFSNETELVKFCRNLCEQQRKQDADISRKFTSINSIGEAIEKEKTVVDKT